ncbi:hypothetical protein WBJ53_05535 [Spirosoma sp. SC4-14]|uniref:hypothetical protein n=1 Tax=Spirosoma sp. SC4-14 TaxID=3128900 RepID=UPI0030CC707F
MANITVPQTILAALLPKHVLTGPFSGMHYIAQSTGSVIVPKLTGSYESELWPVLQAVHYSDYDLFVDIGAAEGYYAVGVTKYIFQNAIPTVAFEATPRGQKQIHMLAQRNGVQNITIKGFCDCTDLLEVLSKKRGFLIVDIEGGEASLLDPVALPDLLNCDMLVELHPEQVEGVRSLLMNRFKNSHTVEEINPDTKKQLNNTALPRWTQRFRTYMLNEFRGNQSWLFFRANKRVA